MVDTKNDNNNGKKRDKEELIHIYPKKRHNLPAFLSVKQEEIRDEADLGDLKKDIDIYNILKQTSHLYLKELDKMEILEATLIQDKEIKLKVEQDKIKRKEELVISTIYCLETALNLLLKIKKYSIDLLTLEFDVIVKECQLRTQLASCLQRFTKNYLRGESMLLKAIQLSQSPNISEVVHYNIRIELAKLHIIMKKERMAISELKSCYQKALETGYIELVYTTCFLLVNVYKKNQQQNQIILLLEEVSSLADKYKHRHMKYLIQMKMIEQRFHFKNIKLMLSLFQEVKEHPNTILKSMNHIYHALVLIYSGQLKQANTLLNNIPNQNHEFILPDHFLEIHYELDTTKCNKMIEIQWLNQKQASLLLSVLKCFCGKALIKDTRLIENFNSAFKMSIGKLLYSFACICSLMILEYKLPITPSVITNKWGLYSILSLNMSYIEYLILNENYKLAKKICLKCILLAHFNNLDESYLIQFIYLLAMIHQSHSNETQANLMYHCLLEMVNDVHFRCSIYFNLISMHLDENNGHQSKLNRYLEKIKGMIGPPYPITIECRLYFFNTFVNRETLSKKNCLNQALQLNQNIQNDMLLSGILISLAKLYLFSDAKASAQLLSQNLNKNSSLLSSVQSLYLLSELYTKDSENGKKTYALLNDKLGAYNNCYNK